jgi:hypothetical protein
MGWRGVGVAKSTRPTVKRGTTTVYIVVFVVVFKGQKQVHNLVHNTDGSQQVLGAPRRSGVYKEGEQTQAEEKPSETKLCPRTDPRRLELSCMD